MSDSQELVGESGTDSLERSQVSPDEKPSDLPARVELEVEVGADSEQPKGTEAPPEDQAKEDVSPPASEPVRDLEEEARRAKKERELQNKSQPGRVRITEER